MDTYEPSVYHLLDIQYMRYYRKYLNKKITYEEWMDKRQTIENIKKLLKKLE